MSNIPTILAERRRFTAKRLGDFVQAFDARLAKCPDGLRPDTCVYVTGSAGRGELSEHSDLDLFFRGHQHGDCHERIFEKESEESNVRISCLKICFGVKTFCVVGNSKHRSTVDPVA